MMLCFVRLLIPGNKIPYSAIAKCFGLVPGTHYIWFCVAESAVSSEVKNSHIWSSQNILGK